jgi:FkbM family methyltransferase
MRKILTKAAAPIIYSPRSHLRVMAKSALLLLNNPSAFFKTAISKVKSFQPMRSGTMQARINGILFDFDFSYGTVTNEMYLGMYEVTTVELMKRFLKEGDTFIDVGANIGYLSTIAMGLVGCSGQVHSFEPVPEYYAKLQTQAKLNAGYRFVVNEVALSDEEASASIDLSSLRNIGFNTMVPGFMSADMYRQTVEVKTYRLDNYIMQKSLDKISLIKIDTEGFEFPILRGLSNCFLNDTFRPPIICEIAPRAYQLLGCHIRQLSDYMGRWDYQAFNVFNIDTTVDITSLEEIANVIFIAKRHI